MFEVLWSLLFSQISTLAYKGSPLLGSNLKLQNRGSRGGDDEVGGRETSSTSPPPAHTAPPAHSAPPAPPPPIVKQETMDTGYISSDLPLVSKLISD